MVGPMESTFIKYNHPQVTMVIIIPLMRRQFVLDQCDVANLKKKRLENPELQ